MPAQSTGSYGGFGRKEVRKPPVIAVGYEVISMLYRADMYDLSAYVEIASYLAMTRFR